MTERDDVVFDTERFARLGFDEAVYGATKSAEQLEFIIRQANDDHRSLLITRLADNQLTALTSDAQSRLDYDPVSRTAILGSSHPARARTQIAIVAAGSSDAPVAYEARRTLAYYGHQTTAILDVGVAGLWRLLDRLDDIKQHPVVIAVAGMEAAIVSVLGGLYGGLMIAVPTSIGYGVGEGGAAALRGSLASCAPGVVVVNIDNGYGAACAALRALNAFDHH